MRLASNIFALDKPSNVKFNLVGTALPTNNDLYFRTKQHELIEQYSAARIFMNETENDDWDHWFQRADKEENQKAFQLIFRSHFYETALFYYNAVVDISWVLTYVAIEFACSKKGTRININGIKPIEESMELLRSAEKNVTAPTAEENPFAYLRIMCPEFEPVIDQIVAFWTNFGSSDIRKNYNFCKHKGRPAYSEIEALRPGRVFGIYVENKVTGEVAQIASDIRDVQYQISLEKSIAELRDFDDRALYPYIKTLLDTIECILAPSPMIV